MSRSVSRSVASKVVFAFTFLILLSPCTIGGVGLVMGGEWLFGLGLLLFNLMAAAGVTGSIVEKMMGPKVVSSEDDSP